jgi:formylmethanofuran dehydrogenase subunit B
MSTIIENVVCAACGCICEEVTVCIENGAISAAEGACAVCAQQLVGQTAGGADSPQIAAAVEILARSRAPLIFGLAESTIEAQRAAVALTEALDGTIDLAVSNFHRDSLRVMQAVGGSTCTLGEIRQRADVVVFWGVDPTSTHPAFWERFIQPRGQFLAGSRHVTSIGSSVPKHPVDDFVQVARADNLTVLAALRGAIASVDWPKQGLLSQQIGQLAERLQKAAYSVIFTGPDVGGFAEIESLYRLVRQLNNRSRCAVIPVGGVQCENVLTWQTGYPWGVNFSQGYPRYDPERYSANCLLERGEVDTVVLIGDKGISELSRVATAGMADLPVVYLGFPGCHVPFTPTLEIVTARPGVHCGGSVFRMDGVPIKLRPVFESPLPTTESVLADIQQGVCASCV